MLPNTLAPAHVNANGNLSGPLPFLKSKDSKHIISMTIEGLNSDDLQFIELSGSESLSHLTPWTVTFAYTGEALSGKNKLGRVKVAVVYDMVNQVNKDEYNKVFTGMLWNVHKPRGQYSSADNKVYNVYQAQIVPVMHFLEYHVDSRVYVGKTVKQIIEAIFAEHGLADADYLLDLDSQGLAATFKIPNCTQYHESDWMFIQRLLMKVGICFSVEHGCDDGRIKHVMHFTDKKPQLVAKEPKSKSLSKPTYFSAKQNPDTVENGWVGMSNLNGHDFPMMSQVIVEGYSYDKPTTQKSQSSSTLSAMGAKVTEHKHYGHFYPEQSFDNTTDGAKFAAVRSNQYDAFQEQAHASFNVPGLSVMQKISLAGKTYPSADNGVALGDYLIYEITFKISLSQSGNSYAAPQFSMKMIPLTADTVAPCPFYQLPPAPVTQTKLHAVVVNAEGKYDASTIEKANTEINGENTRDVFIAFEWDQAKRQDSEAELTPVPAQYFGHSGIAASPMVGSRVLVEYLAFDQPPVLLGVQYHSSHQAFKKSDVAGELMINRQPIDAETQENTGHIAIIDGTKPDAEKKQQNIEIYSPALLNILAAQGADEGSKVTITADAEGNIIIKGASLTIDVAKDITLKNSKGSVNLDENGNVKVETDQDVSLKPKGNFIAQASKGVEITGNSSLKVTTEGQLEVTGSSTAKIGGESQTTIVGATVNSA